MISRNDYFIGEGAYQSMDAILDILTELNKELNELYKVGEI